MTKAICALGFKVKSLKKKAIGWGKKTALFNKIAKMYSDLDRKVRVLSRQNDQLKFDEGGNHITKESSEVQLCNITI